MDIDSLYYTVNNLYMLDLIRLLVDGTGGGGG